MIILLLGPSGVGKTTIAQKLGIPQVLSTTTRAMRPGEEDGVTYHFVTPEEFDSLNLIEEVEYAGNRYGLQWDDVHEALNSDEDHYIIMNRKGCEIVKDMFQDVYIIFLTAPPKKLVGFMRKRGDNDEAIINRLCNIITDRELDNEEVADLVCETGDIPSIVEKIKNYIEGLRLTSSPRLNTNSICSSKPSRRPST